MADMEFEKFVRKPFIVEVVQITAENIEEIAKLVGELRDQDGKPYIRVNNNVVPGIQRVHIGYYMTRMGDNIRCYNKRVFASQFCPATPEIVEWVEYIKDAIVKQEVGDHGRITETVEGTGETPVVPEEVSSG